MTISNEQITAWKEAAKAATVGPWKSDLGHYFSLSGPDLEVLFIYEDGSVPTPEDAHFIAIAREAVPALIAEVERLQALVAETGG